MASENSLNRFTHAFKSDVQLLQCTMATISPAGVVTRSISGYTCSSSFSNTTMANTLVPADTFPVRTATLLVAAMPVPASPSGGHMGIPAFKFPDASRSFAPSSVRTPASSPATRALGKMSRSFHGKFSPATSWSNCSTRFWSKSLAWMSTGNMPATSPMPRTRLPVSFQCTYPSSVMR